jgi:hypothetical protein
MLGIEAGCSICYNPTVWLCTVVKHGMNNETAAVMKII